MIIINLLVKAHTSSYNIVEIKNIREFSENTKNS